MITAIIPSFNRSEELDRCLSSLEGLGRDDLEIIVVDNGSTDETLEMMRLGHPGARLLGNTRNVGASLAKNQGAGQASGEVLWFLDSDTVVTASPELVDEALSLLASDAGVGAVGGEVYQREDGSREWRQKVLLLNGETRTISHHRGYGRTLEVDYLPSCNLFMRRALFQEVGGFDPGYFFLMEDTDLCFRLGRMGYRCLASDGTAVEHRLVLRGRKGDLFLSHRNRIRFALLNYPAWRVAALPLFDLAYAASPYKLRALLGGDISADKHLSPSVRAMGKGKATLPLKVALVGADYFYSLGRGYLWNMVHLGNTVGLRLARSRSFL